MRLLVFLSLISWAWAQPATPNDPSVRHAGETDKAAIFGFMINARSGEMRGNSIRSIYAQTAFPLVLCGILCPLYLRLSRRYHPRPEDTQ